MDTELSRVQDNVAEAVEPIERSLIWKGRKLVVDLTTSPSLVAHGLGRVYEGWQVADKDAAEDVYQPVADFDKSKYLRLQATGPVRAVLWVY